MAGPKKRSSPIEKFREFAKFPSLIEARAAIAARPNRCTQELVVSPKD
jgi:hypothetical protein